MPVCSYLVYPVSDHFHDVLAHLNSLSECEAVADDENRIIILVTETDTEQDNQSLHERLSALPDIDCIAMTFGEFTDTV